MKLDHLPKVRGENEKYLSCHHLSKISPTGAPGKKNHGNFTGPPGRYPGLVKFGVSSQGPMWAKSLSLCLVSGG